MLQKKNLPVNKKLTQERTCWCSSIYKCSICPCRKERTKYWKNFDSVKPKLESRNNKKRQNLKTYNNNNTNSNDTSLPQNIIDEN